LVCVTTLVMAQIYRAKRQDDYWVISRTGCHIIWGNPAVPEFASQVSSQDLNPEILEHSIRIFCMCSFHRACGIWVGSISVAWSGGPGFKSWSGYRLSSLRVAWFISVLEANAGIISLKRTRQLPFTSFPVHHSNTPFHLTLCFEALCYKPEGRGFKFRWSHWIFQLT
jgi:hypothetical protein